MTKETRRQFLGDAAKLSAAAALGLMGRGETEGHSDELRQLTADYEALETAFLALVREKEQQELWTAARRAPAQASRTKFEMEEFRKALDAATTARTGKAKGGGLAREILKGRQIEDRANLMAVETIQVSPEDDIQTIVDSIQPAEYGQVEVQTILELQGGETYRLDATILIEGKPIMIRAVGSQPAIIDCQGLTSAFEIYGDRVSTAWDKMQVILENVVIANGESDYNGGGIDVVQQTELTLRRVGFDNCHGVFAGAMLASNYCHVFLEEVSVDGCSSDYQGGGIKLLSCEKIRMDQVTVENCESNGIGAAMYISFNDGTYDKFFPLFRAVNSQFCNNHSAYDVAGGVIFANADNGHFENCNISNNTANGEASDLALDRSCLTHDAETTTGDLSMISGSTFELDNPPTAIDDEASVDEGETIVIDVLANDSDAEGPFTLKDWTEPAHGTLALNAWGKLTYTPNATFTSGIDTFTYTVIDKNLQESTAQVTISINPDTGCTIFLPIVLEGH